jgi:hypothetical protein
MTLKQRYEAWRKTPESEEVFTQMHRMARQTAGRGVRFGVKAFAEIMRWERMLRGERTEKVKVNNSYVSLLARELVSLDPSLKPFFAMRKLAAEREKFPQRWLAQVNGPRRIPTARPWPRQQNAA